MSPPAVSVHPERILDAAFLVVREEGLGALSARNVAKRLGTSVGPIYRSWNSMDALTRAVLDRALEQLREYASRGWASTPFRSAGIGTALFARDEPNLYRALFFERHVFRDEIKRSFRDEMYLTMRKEEVLRHLSQEKNLELLEDLWIYTHGLAMMLVSGEIADASEEAINRRISNIGYVMIMAKLGDTTKDLARGTPGTREEREDEEEEECGSRR